MLSSFTLLQYSLGVSAIQDAAGEYVSKALMRAWSQGVRDTATLRELAISAVLGAADEYGNMVRELACSLYEEQTGEEAAFSASTEVNSDAIEKAVRYQAGKLDGTDAGIRRFAKACSEQAGYLARRDVNEEIIGNCQRSRRKGKRGRLRKGHGGIRFARIPQGGDTCTFCAMLASRGFVYWSRETAGEFNHYHRNCRCLVVPDDGSGEVEGYDSSEWYERWKAYEEIDASGRLTTGQRATAKRYVSVGVSPDATDAIERVLSEPVAASPVFLNKSSELYRRMKKIKPLDGYYDVMGHSDGFSLIYGDLNDIDDEPGTAFTMEELKATILSDKSYNGDPIRIVACDAGAAADGLAQRLADEMGVDVLAPTASVYVDYDGRMTLAATLDEYEAVLGGRIEERGRWVTFHPGRHDE